MSGPVVAWRGPLLDGSGYADEGRAMVRALVARGVDLRLDDPPPWGSHQPRLSDDDRRMLQALPARTGAADVSVQHCFPPLADVHTPAGARVLRTMFETDRIAREWVKRCNAFDEVWVPTAHNVEAFAASGVDRGRLQVVPSPIEIGRYDPALAPLEIPEAHGTVFLSVFDWSRRKGWDALLAAWAEAMRADDDACLVLKVWRGADRDAQTYLDGLVMWATGRGIDPDDLADVIVLDEPLSPEQMVALYAACDVVVSATRGEGWGRPLVEGMAMGRPVIATDWSGPSEFLDDTCGWPVPARVVDVPPSAWEELPGFRGHRWAEPDVGSLAAAMREAADDPAGRRLRGRAARERAERYASDRVAELMAARMAALARPVRPVAVDPRPPVLLEGDPFGQADDALLTRALATAIEADGRLALDLRLSSDPAPGDADAEHVLRELAGPLERRLTRPPALHIRVRHPLTGEESRRPGPWPNALVVSGAWAAALREGIPATMLDAVDDVWLTGPSGVEPFMREGWPAHRLHLATPFLPAPVHDHPFPGPLPDGPMLLAVARPGWLGGLDIALDAWDLAAASTPGHLVVVDATLVGRVPGGARLTPAEGRTRVWMADGVGERDVQALAAAARALVHVPRADGLGLVVLRAAAAGVPAIVPLGGPWWEMGIPAAGLRGVAARAWMQPAADLPPDLRQEGGWLNRAVPVIEADTAELARAMRELLGRRVTVTAAAAGGAAALVDAIVEHLSGAAEARVA